MVILVTTSRKPCQDTRSVARLLARLIGGVYFSRGKASFDSVMQEAESAGTKRVLFIGESHGNVGSLGFWQDAWLEPELLVKSTKFARGNMVSRVGKVVADDEFGEKLKGLFEMGAGEGATRMILNSRGISFTQGAKLLLEFKLK